MSVLSVLSGLASAGGDFARGYAHDEEGRVKDALAQAKAAQDAERNHVLNLLTQRQIATPILGEEGYTKGHADVAGAEANAKVPAAVSEARALAPIKVQQAVDTASGTAPIEVKKAADIATATMPIDVEKSVRTARGIAPIQQQTHATNKLFDDAHPASQISIQNPQTPGEPARVVVASAADPAHPKVSTVEIPGVSKGSAGGGALAGPIAAKVGQFGEMLKKAHDLTSLTDNLNVGVGESATRDLAEHGVHVPLFGTVPGTKGIGNALMSQSPEYAQYQAALSPFVLAAAHALSGARINQDQVEQIRKSIELAPGDFTNKNVRAQKEKNLIDLINSIGGSLPSQAIGQQEGQMDEEALQALVGRGYRRIGNAGGGASGAAHKTVVVNGKTFVLP